MCLKKKPHALPSKSWHVASPLWHWVRWLGKTVSCAFLWLSAFSWLPGCWKSMSLTLVTKAKQNSDHVAFALWGWCCSPKNPKNRSCVTRITHFVWWHRILCRISPWSFVLSICPPQTSQSFFNVCFRNNILCGIVSVSRCNYALTWLSAGGIDIADSTEAVHFVRECPGRW